MDDQNRIRLPGGDLVLLKADITAQSSDIIVNAANPGLLGGGGVDGAIHKAGGSSILAECRKIRQESGPCPPGQCVITGGGNLKAKHVIHTVGPIWQGGNSNEKTILANAYRKSLELAEQYDAVSIAFPSISTGAYGYPVTEASVIALSQFAEFFKEPRKCLKTILMVLYDKETYDIYAKTAESIFKL